MKLTTPQFCRHAAGSCGLVEKYGTVLIACGMLVARSWLPQALVLPTFFRNVFVEWKMLAVQCICHIMESLCNDGNHALVKG